jgi:hypothetical protein
MAKNNAFLGAGLIPWLLSDPKIRKGTSNFLFGSEDEFKKLPTGTPEQEQLHNSILSQAMNMSNGGGYDRANQYYNNLLGDNQQQAFNQFSQPYLQQFQEQMLPQIAERFAGAGALSSSGFGQALGGASSNLQAQLAQLFSQLQSQAAQQQYGQYNQLAQTGLNHQQFAYQHKPGSQGFLGTALGAAGTALGGPIGGALGNLIGGGISSLFKPKAAAGGIT